MSEWQDIATAPKDGTRVLLWCVETAGEISRPEPCSLAYVGEWWGGTSDYPGSDWWTLCGDGYAFWGRAIAWACIPEFPQSSPAPPLAAISEPVGGGDAFHVNSANAKVI